MKAFADDKINVNQSLKFDLERVENIVGKGENTGYQHFLLFHIVFKSLFLSVVKSRDCMVGKELLEQLKHCSIIERVGNIFAKGGENAVYQQFLLFLLVFKKHSLKWGGVGDVIKFEIVW